MKKKGMLLAIFTSVLFFLIGLLLFMNPNEVVKIVTYLFGGLFLFIGIIYILQYFKNPNKQFLSSELYSGITSFMIGILIMFCVGAIELAVRIITGIWIFYRAIERLHFALVLKDLNNKKWIVFLVIAFVFFAAALYIVLKSNLVLSSIGLLLMIYSIVEFGNAIYGYFEKNTIEIVK